MAAREPHTGPCAKDWFARPIRLAAQPVVAGQMISPFFLHLDKKTRSSDHMTESLIDMESAFAVPLPRHPSATRKTTRTTKAAHRRTAIAKRSLSEGDLTKAADTPRKRRRKPAFGVMLVRTSDGATFSLDVSPDGRFAARFPHSHLVPTDHDDAVASDGSPNTVERRLDLANVDRVAFAPVYAHVAFDGADFGPRGTIEINGLVASALAMCMDRLDDVDAAAAALGVPEVASMLRTWVDAATPCRADTGNPVRIAAAEGAIDVSCAFCPRDLDLVEAALGVQGAEQFCADVFSRRLGTTQSHLVVRMPLPRFDPPLALSPAVTVGTGTSGVDDPEWLPSDAPLRGWLPFLAATSHLDSLPGAYERARSALAAHKDDPMLCRPLDDLRLLACELPSRACVDNPYHIAAAFFCCVYGVNARAAQRAIEAAVDGDMSLLGLLMDANATCGLLMPPPPGGHDNGPRIESFITDHYLGDLGLTESDLHVVDDAIALYYRDHDRFRRRFPPCT
ncbi:hypothetical protein psal_cds_377 [Pandoravirus salinus]|uniref:Uncharacterized protein n=1 Tax=Pandoravirus salinus TaxID=1349410 RepID=S4VUN4_9VIRU|nr:hypothetical protein psal_cds_377 [Pandoravirus salinus]AGO84053.1 hypothetical protein psal_cds_377 [Pandoravirus salinus]